MGTNYLTRNWKLWYKVGICRGCRNYYIDECMEHNITYGRSKNEKKEVCSTLKCKWYNCDIKCALLSNYVARNATSFYWKYWNFTKELKRKTWRLQELTLCLPFPTLELSKISANMFKTSDICEKAFPLSENECDVGYSPMHYLHFPLFFTPF